MTGRWHLGWGGGVAHAQVEVDWPYTQYTRVKYVALLLYHQRLVSQTVCMAGSGTRRSSGARVEGVTAVWRAEVAPEVDRSLPTR